MEVTGKIKLIGEVKTYGSKGFRKAELILDVTDNTEYPQFVNIDITQDTTDLLSNFKVGQQVKVSINLGGREWVSPQGETKYFNSIQGWRIESQEVIPGEKLKEAAAIIDKVMPAADDDLPF